MFVFLMLWAASGSPSYGQCDSEQQENYANYYSPDLLEYAHTVFVCEGRSIAENGEFITALATIALVFSTILLWLATRETAKIAERSLTDLERPWLHVTDIDVEGILTNPPTLLLEKVNYGRTVGTIKGIKAGFKVSPNEIDPASVPIKDREMDEVRNTIPPDKPYTSRARFKEYAHANIPVLIDAGDAKVVFRGVLVYRGLTDQAFETGFCFRYDAERKILVRYGGDEYNYTK